MVRLLYQIKAFICVRLNLWQKEYRERGEYYLLESEGGSGFNSYDGYTQYWFHDFGVGYGMFKNWWVIEYSDSD